MFGPLEIIHQVVTKKNVGGSTRREQISLENMPLTSHTSSL
jgi:hypothetical protein